jgi:hypothetical protein
MLLSDAALNLGSLSEPLSKETANQVDGFLKLCFGLAAMQVVLAAVLTVAVTMCL